MRNGDPRARTLALLAGVLLGVLVGTVVVAGPAVAHRLRALEATPFLEATHLPPLLTAADGPVELRYDVYCAPAEERADEPCDVEGSVFVRTGEGGPFGELLLEEAPNAEEGRLVARVPNGIASAPTGFYYYAVLRGSGESTVRLPGGGASAPQRSLPLGRTVEIDLGRHEFGRTRTADARVAEAAWGEDDSEVGLEQGRTLPVGGSAFDVGTGGTVHLLDEAKRRVLRWRPGSSEPDAIALPINGTLADLAVADDGTTYVLETTARDGEEPLLRGFDEHGEERGTVQIAERASRIRLAPDGSADVLQHPSGQWMRVAAGGRLLDAARQRASGRPGQPLRGGRELVVLRGGGEVRVAVAGPEGTRRSWQVVSETHLAEVQLAELLGGRLVLVVRVYSEVDSEFLVLVLGAGGLTGRFSLPSAEWAETAPLSRFRLRGSSLYQLGSTPAGLFVDRFDLEVS